LIDPASPPLSRSRIAIVDDDEDLRMLVRHSLELRGYRVLEFESAEQALGWEREPASPESPPLEEADLVLLDVSLPGLSGIETIGLMKESPRLKGIPIAMLTARNEADVVLRCIRAGASDYFVKPLDAAEMLRRVDRLLSDPSGMLGKAAKAELTWNFQELLVREIKRSERAGLPVGLLLGAIRKISSRTTELSADEIDRLWSAPAGHGNDLRPVVEGFVAACKRRLREYDILVPFGTGEFAAILPATDRGGRDAVVRKIHQAFQSEIDLPPLSRRERWGLLVGSSSHPEDGKDSLSLFTAAESTLTDRAPGKAVETAGDDLTFTKTLRCPGCGRHFKQPKIAARRLKPISRETDLRKVFEEMDPLHYGVVACTHCGLAVLESDAGFLRNLAPPAFGWSYKQRSSSEPLSRSTQTLIPDELVSHLSPPFEAWIEERRRRIPLQDLPERIPNRMELLAQAVEGDPLRLTPSAALGRYLLARETAILAGASPLRRARLAHRIAWLYRAEGKTKEERRYLSEALEYYLTAYHFEDLTGAKPSDQELLYLLGELSFRLGREADAVAVFEHLVRDPRLEANPSFLKMVRRRWFEARHEEDESS